MWTWVDRVGKTAIATVVLTAGMVMNAVAIAGEKIPVSKGTLVSLGDSITFGYNLNDTSKNSVVSKFAYPNLIGKAERLNVSDLGVPGWTSTDLLAALDAPNFSRAVRGASVVTVDIGSNDLLHWADQQELLTSGDPASLTITSTQQLAVAQVLAQFGSNFKHIIAKIRAETSAPIVAYNLYDPFPSSSPLSTDDEQLEAFENQEIAFVAGQYQNVAVADAHGAFTGNQLSFVRLAQGDVHPTARGQSALAQVGEQAMKSLLKQQVKPGVQSGVTHLLVGEIAPNEGTTSGNVNGSAVTLSVPPSALKRATEVDLTSQQFPEGAESAIATKWPRGHFAVELALNFDSNTTFVKAYTLTVKNRAIAKGAKVYQVTGKKLTIVKTTSTKAGQLTVKGTKPADFVILNPD
ncbi:SGNH/GDSL hydrolase family protein [Alicyclobacillus fastidiosus]|uniref:GDSL-type esterase/lipase family protein n=1 Tax=Alicyclobacillus fastidiosus TaxID=392011 RepID=A0ABV5A962_9BACL|nr:GDSL-type esterase/lipase family protein [Alicyclobacillus fastidiosus]WEH10752.1 GDSL-type esterase/lipase family protein [Alicyclobacillus fastidiosus]